MNSNVFHEEYFSEFGTDSGYFHAHYSRFLTTKNIYEDTARDSAGMKKVLDVGAHWLHQSLLWRSDGYEVIAADVPDTLAVEGVKKLAEKNNIRLISYEKMNSGKALDSVESNSIDVVLFCEIIEHITFNPVSFWSEIYRVISPGGCIVVTTPNYYWARGRAWDIGRVVKRLGGGLSVEELLRTPTYGPHWKEFSLRELALYFSLLSPDFQVNKTVYVPDPRGLPQPKNNRERIRNFVESSHRVFRWGLHVEVNVPNKQHGIGIVPSWG